MPIPEITAQSAPLFFNALKLAADATRAKMKYKSAEKYKTALTLEAAAYETEAEKLLKAYPESCK